METTIWQEYQNENVTVLGLINTSDQSLINNFVAENSITFPILFDPGSSGGVQGGDTYDDYYMPNDGSPYPRDFIVDQEGILQYANNEIDTEWMMYVLNELIGDSSEGIAGDVNNDGLINILDVIQTVNIILGANPNPTDYELWAADMNQDGNIDILDIVLIVNTILGQRIGLAQCLSAYGGHCAPTNCPSFKNLLPNSP